MLADDNTKFDERLDCYIDEIKLYDEYLTEVEEQIGEKKDLKQIDCMRELMDDAVHQHLEMCDTVVADLVDCSLDCEKALKMAAEIGIEIYLPPGYVQDNKFIHEYKRKQIAEADKEIKPPKQ